MGVWEYGSVDKVLVAISGILSTLKYEVYSNYPGEN